MSNSNSNRKTFIQRINRTAPIPELKKPKKPFQKKVHVSTWFITLNSNLKAGRKTKTANEIESDLVNILTKTFENNSNLVRFLKFNTRYLTGLTSDSLSEEMLEDTVLFPDIPGEYDSNRKLTWVREVGSKMRRVHLHAEFRIIHYTNLRIDYKQLQEVAAEYIPPLSGLKSVYLHLRYIPSALPIYNYMMKGDKLKRLHHNQLKKNYDPDSDFEEAVRQLRNLQI